MNKPNPLADIQPTIITDIDAEPVFKVEDEPTYCCASARRDVRVHPKRMDVFDRAYIASCEMTYPIFASPDECLRFQYNIGMIPDGAGYTDEGPLTSHVANAKKCGLPIIVLIDSEANEIRRWAVTA